MDYTASALLSSIRRRAMMPTASATGTADADLLAIANEETQAWLVPLLLALREEYLVQRSTTATAVGTSEYRIPARAVGHKLREVEIVTSANEVRNLARIGPDELEDWPQGSNGTPSAFYVRANYVVLVPTPAVAETLRLTYYLRPSELTATASQYEAITGIAGSVLTLADTTGLTGSVDLVSATGHDVLSVGVTATGSTGTTLTFSSLPTGLAVGDYVCVADKTPIPNVPGDFHPLLAQRVAVKLMEAQGDVEGMKAAGAVLAEMEAGLRVTYAPRVDGEAKIVAPGSEGLMGGAWNSSGWW